MNDLRIYPTIPTHYGVSDDFHGHNGTSIPTVAYRIIGN